MALMLPNADARYWLERKCELSCCVMSLLTDGDEMNAMREHETKTAGFGKLLRGCLNRKRPPELTLTKFVTRLANDSGVSSRTIWRLLDSDEWPTPDTISKLSTVIPDLMYATPDSSSILARWEVVLEDQMGLPSNSTICILSSDDEPKALHDDEMAKGLAINVLARSIQYVFVFPPYPKRSIDWLRPRLGDKVFLAAYELIRNNHPELSKFQSKADEAKAKIAQSLYIFETDESEESWKLWGKAPRYTVLYNVRTAAPDSFPKYGMFWNSLVSGYSSPFPEHEPEIVSGWGYLSLTDSDKLCAYLEDPSKGVLSEASWNAWPIPGGENT